jgi:hypothetical protein
MIEIVEKESGVKAKNTQPQQHNEAVMESD